jgi:hypothetical protein
MNQLAISSQLNLQQSSPSAGQPIEQASPAANMQSSSGQGRPWYQIHSQES